MKLKAVLFDAGEVIYHRPRRNQQLHAFLSSVGADDHLDADAERQATELKRASWLGEINASQYHLGMLGLHGVDEPEAISRGLEVWQRVWPDVELFDGVRDTLGELHQRGIGLGVVTNTLNATEEKLSWFSQRGMDRRWWGAFATSCELGLIKPDPAIYQAALTELDVDATDAAFVGHAQLELDGAKDVGLATIAFNRDDETVTADVVVNEFAQLLDVVEAQVAPSADMAR